MKLFQLSAFVIAPTLGLALASASSAQQTDPTSPLSLQVTPEQLTLEVGQQADLKAVVKTASGEESDAKVVFFSRARRSVGVNALGQVSAYKPGEFTIVALVPSRPDDRPGDAQSRARVEIPVTVSDPPIEQVRFQDLPTVFYASTQLPLSVHVVDLSGVARADVEIGYTSTREEVASIDTFGQLWLHRPGRTVITARAESVSDSAEIRVVRNPVARLSMESSTAEALTGDVVYFEATPLDSKGREIQGIPIRYSVSGQTDPLIIASGAPAQISSEGGFVAERSGVYTVVATAGNLSSQRTVRVRPRQVRRRIEVVGHAPVQDRHTSDLWVWEGVDGRDYAITGTWGADGHAYIWDVTSPNNMSLIDVVRVDARTVNDVKVSQDGRVAVISREGASNRKNGLVLLDVSSPAEGVRILARYDDQMTGGVHNVFIYENHIYALSAGRRYDIISIENPEKPTRVGRFELETPGHGVHDVWVSEGIAYSSNWADGVVAVDIGGAHCDGSVSQPAIINSFSHPNGWNHAAFPYRSKSNGKFYVFAGDEAFPYGKFNPEGGGQPQRAAGWIHVIEWSHWEKPKEVARYQVPEAGTHNLWVEDDILYVGYYNGGLRVVDVSGDLMGDLYKQGREIGFWHPYDPKGFVANAPFSWGPQPFKGHIFVSDFNSGLWAVKISDKKGPNLGEPQ